MPRSNVVEKLALSMRTCPSLEGAPRAVIEEVIEQTLRHLDLVVAAEIPVGQASEFYDGDATFCDHCAIALDDPHLMRLSSEFVCRDRDACARRLQERVGGGLDG